jgi:hypothetical protein
MPSAGRWPGALNVSAQHDAPLHDAGLYDGAQRANGGVAIVRDVALLPVLKHAGTPECLGCTDGWAGRQMNPDSIQIHMHWHLERNTADSPS